MLEVFQSNTARDFRQRYSGSYGYYTVPESKKRVLVYVSGVTETLMEFVDELQTRYTAHADTGVEFDFIPVQKRLFSVKDMLYLVERRPARMWSRGVNAQNTTCTRVATGSNQALNFAMVKGAFEQGAPEVLQKLKLLENKEASTVVLSDMFGVINSTLYLYDEVIGSFMVDRKEIKVDEPMFRQEVEDLVTRYSLPYKVVSNA